MAHPVLADISPLRRALFIATRRRVFRDAMQDDLHRRHGTLIDPDVPFAYARRVWRDASLTAGVAVCATAYSIPPQGLDSL